MVVLQNLAKTRNWTLFFKEWGIKYLQALSQTIKLFEEKSRDNQASLAEIQTYTNPGTNHFNSLPQPNTEAQPQRPASPNSDYAGAESAQTLWFKPQKVMVHYRIGLIPWTVYLPLSTKGNLSYSFKLTMKTGKRMRSMCPLWHLNLQRSGLDSLIIFLQHPQLPSVELQMVC